MKYIITILALALASLVGIFIYNYPLDNTDRSKSERSGMTLYTDYGTGCQYLSIGVGTLTPRINDKGEHVCYDITIIRENDKGDNK